jgi:hypothetical protein
VGSDATDRNLSVSQNSSRTGLCAPAVAHSDRPTGPQNDININTAICNEAKQLRLVSDVEGENVGRYAASGRHAILWVLTPSCSNVVYEFLSEDYRRQYYSHLRTEDDLERATRGWLSCIPVRDLLSLLRLRHIDMFSLDVEGASD